METALAILAVVGGFGLLGLLVGLDTRHYRAVGGHRPGGYPRDPYADGRPARPLGAQPSPSTPGNRARQAAPGAPVVLRPRPAPRPTPAARNHSPAA